MESGIYKIKNVIDGKIYIGQSVNVQRRLKVHKNRLTKGSHENNYLQNAVIKYGIDNFTFEIIEFCKLDLLDEKERFYISFYNSIERQLQKL